MTDNADLTDITTFKPTKIQEAYILSDYSKGDEYRKYFNSARQSGKSFIVNELVCRHLLNMKEGYVFGLAGLEGIRMFKLTEIRRY